MEPRISGLMAKAFTCKTLFPALLLLLLSSKEWSRIEQIISQARGNDSSMKLLFQIPLLQYKIIYFLLVKKVLREKCLPWGIKTLILRLKKFLDQNLRNSALWTRSLVDPDILWTWEFPVWETTFCRVWNLNRFNSHGRADQHISSTAFSWSSPI